MKSKKSKLFLSVSTLMLCFGVMCFGVFAASTVTYNLSGNISYELDDVFVDVDTTQYVSKMSELPRAQGNVMQDMQDIKESIENGTELPTERVEQLSYLDHQTTYNNGGVDTETNVFENESPLDIRLGSYKTGEKGYVNIIAVTVTNYANAVINAQMDLSAVTASDNVDIIQLNQIDDVPSAVDGAPSKATFCFAVILQDELTAIPSLEFTGAKLSVSKGSLDERQSSGFTFEKLTSEDGTATGYAIVGYSGSDENLIIPSYHQEEGDAEPLPVIQLGKSGVDGVFYNNTNIKTVYIPDTVKNYFGNAMYPLFMKCSNLEFLYIPEGAETFPIFGYCQKLVSINIPNSITNNLPGYSLAESRALKYVNLNKQTYMTSSVVSNCSALEVVCLDSMLDVSWGSVGNTSLKYIYFPDDIQSFSGLGFSGTQIEELVFKNPNVNVSDLNNITSLKRLTLGMTNIPSGLMNASSSKPNTTLEKVTFLDTVNTIGDSAFAYCEGLTGTFTIPNTITSVGSAAFYGCENINQVVLPEGIQKLGDRVFGDCTSLTDINFPESLEYVSSDAFRNTAIKNLIVPQTTGTFTFTTSYPNLESLTISCNVARQSGSSISLPKLKTLILKDTVTSIGDNAFSNCSSLSGTLVIPDSVTSLGSNCFAYCSSLTKIELGSGITKLSSSEFFGCSSVTELVLSEGLTEIGYHSLDMSGLKTITIPASVIKISSQAFGSNVEQLIFLDQENEWSGGADKTITTEQLKDSQYLADLMCRDDRNTTWNKVQVTG